MRWLRLIVRSKEEDNCTVASFIRFDSLHLNVCPTLVINSIWLSFSDFSLNRSNAASVESSCCENTRDTFIPKVYPIVWKFRAPATMIFAISSYFHRETCFELLRSVFWHYNGKTGDVVTIRADKLSTHGDYKGYRQSPNVYANLCLYT